MIVLMNFRSNASARFSIVLLWASSDSPPSATHSASEWSDSSWSASLQSVPKRVGELLNDARQRLELEFLLASLAGPKERLDLAALDSSANDPSGVSSWRRWVRSTSGAHAGECPEIQGSEHFSCRLVMPQDRSVRRRSLTNV